MQPMTQQCLNEVTLHYASDVINLAFYFAILLALAFVPAFEYIILKIKKLKDKKEG